LQRAGFAPRSRLARVVSSQNRSPVLLSSARRAIVSPTRSFGVAMSAQTETWPRPHRLTVDDYDRMAEAGVLSPDDRTELIEGEIIDMAPVDSAHAEVVTLLTQRLIGKAGGSAVVRPQLPVRLSAHSEPQPDLALVKNKSRRVPARTCCTRRHPAAHRGQRRDARLRPQ
jgi:hypothetical protein